MAHTLTVRSTAERPPAPDVGPGDATLVLAAKRERAAFAPLYQRYVDPIYRYCYRCLGNRHTAEDATSLIFTKALAALGIAAGAVDQSEILVVVAEHSGSPPRYIPECPHYLFGVRQLVAALATRQ